MSAFLVSKKHIDTLVSAAVQYGTMGVRGHETAVGQRLWEANVKSLNAHFGSKVEKRTYEFEKALVPEPVEVLKAIQCYEYQSGDFPGYDKSEAAKLCASLTAKAVTKLPGYDDAPWGL